MPTRATKTDLHPKRSSSFRQAVEVCGAAAALVILSDLAAVAAQTCPTDENCISNPSFANLTGTPPRPSQWRTNTFASNIAKFEVVPGRLDDRAGGVTVTAFSGAEDAKWVFDPVRVVGGQYFEFSDWYKANVPTEIFAYFSGGRLSDLRIGSAPASPVWMRLTTPGFFVPAGATSMTVSHNLIGTGNLITDDYSLVLRRPPVFERGLVSLTFDDGWKSIYENAIPLLNKAGMKSTQYIYTDPVISKPNNFAHNVSLRDILVMQAQGHEIGAHTRSHNDLVSVVTGNNERESEIKGSKAELISAGVSNVSTFAYPYGHYDGDLERIVGENFIGARSADLGFNTTNVDRFALKTQLVLQATPSEQIKGWIDYALANRLWLILTFHRVERNPADCTEAGTGIPDQSCTDVFMLQSVINYLKQAPAGTVLSIREVLETKGLWNATPEPVSWAPRAHATTSR